MTSELHGVELVRRGDVGRGRSEAPAPSFSASVSTATISAAPAMRAPWMAAIPTPPQPITHTDEPGRMRAVLIAAPTPVVTPQPISATTSSGISGSTFDHRVFGDDHLFGEGSAAQEARQAPFPIPKWDAVSMDSISSHR